MAVVPSPGVIVTVAESLIRNLGRFGEWSDLWGIKLNPSKTKAMIVSRSRTIHPQSPPLTIGGTVLKESDDLLILFWFLFLGNFLNSCDCSTAKSKTPPLLCDI